MRSSGNCSFLSKSQEDPYENPRRPDITDRRVDLVSQDWTLRHKEGLGPNLQILTRWLSSNRWQGWKVSFYILFLGCQQGLKALYTSLRAFCPIKGQFPPLWPSKAFTQPISYLVLWFLSYQLYFPIGYFRPRPAGQDRTGQDSSGPVVIDPPGASKWSFHAQNMLATHAAGPHPFQCNSTNRQIQPTQ